MKSRDQARDQVRVTESSLGTKQAEAAKKNLQIPQIKEPGWIKRSLVTSRHQRQGLGKKVVVRAAAGKVMMAVSRPGNQVGVQGPIVYRKQ